MQIATPAADNSKSTFLSIATDKIRPSQHQARKSFDEEAIQSLAESMKEEGLLQPISVRQAGDEYELISGERRLRAAKLLAWPTIDAKLIQTVSEGEAAAKGLIENLQREDLNPMEEAEGFAELNGLDPKYWTQAQIGKTTGRSETFVNRSLGLLRLPDPIKENLRARKFSRSHALELARLTDPEQQLALAKKIPGHLTWEETRKLVDSMVGDGKKPAKKTALAAEANEPTDPLADLWPGLQANLDLGSNVHWEVRYGAHKLESGVSTIGWFFFLLPQAEAPKPAMAAWFRQMGQALGGTPIEPELPGFVMEQKRAEQGLMDALKPRLPASPEEQKELEKIALHDGPPGIYTWIYGSDSPMTKMSPKTWEEAGVQDSLEGLRQILEGIRQFQGR